MKIFIIYDQFNRAAKAYAIIRDVIQKTGKDDDQVCAWELHLLKFSRTRNEALREAIDADLLMLATEEKSASMPWLVDWFEQWAIQRRVLDAAVAVFSGMQQIATAFDIRGGSSLRRLAVRHHLTLISDFGVESEAQATFLNKRFEPLAGQKNTSFACSTMRS